MVAVGMAHQVGIEVGQEPYRWLGRVGRELLEVGGQQIRALPFDGNRRQLIGQTCPRGVAHPWPITPPARKVDLGRGPIRAQVPACDFDQGRIRVYVSPAAEPLLRPHERDALAATGTKAQQSVACYRLEDATPAGSENRLNLFRVPLPHPIYQLLASGRPSSAWPMASMSPENSDWFMCMYLSQALPVRIQRVRIAPAKRGRSSAGSRCKVPRMSHVLASVLSLQSAALTSSTLHSARTAT